MCSKYNHEQKIRTIFILMKFKIIGPCVSSVCFGVRVSRMAQNKQYKQK